MPPTWLVDAESNTPGFPRSGIGLSRETQSIWPQFDVTEYRKRTSSTNSAVT
jgi:hypothetical protein